jgi:hypothetical protein
MDGALLTLKIADLGLPGAASPAVMPGTAAVPGTTAVPGATP